MTERNFLADCLPRELILHSTSSIVTKPPGFVGVFEQPYYGVRDLGIAAGIDEQSGFPMYHGLGHAPDSAADNRLAERICLKKCYSEPFALGWLAKTAHRL